MENSLLKREEGYKMVMNYVSWRELCESVFECAQKKATITNLTINVPF